MTLSARYVKAFEAKWMGGSIPEGESLLGTADLQSLADLNNAIGVVKSMRWITVGPRLLTMMTLAHATAVVPVPARGTGAEILLADGRLVIIDTNV